MIVGYTFAMLDRDYLHDDHSTENVASMLPRVVWPSFGEACEAMVQEQVDMFNEAYIAGDGLETPEEFEGRLRSAILGARVEVAPDGARELELTDFDGGWLLTVYPMRARA